MSAVLHVHRDSKRDTRYRGIYISLDGIFVSELRFGAHVEVALNPGKHVLTVDNTWAKKHVQLDVEEGAEYAAQVGSSAMFFFMLMMAFLNTAPMKVFVQIVRIGDGLESLTGEPP